MARYDGPHILYTGGKYLRCANHPSVLSQTSKPFSFRVIANPMIVRNVGKAKGFRLAGSALRGVSLAIGSISQLTFLIFLNHLGPCSEHFPLETLVWKAPSAHPRFGRLPMASAT